MNTSAIATRGSARALLEACRPRQWVKNVLVFAAPATAGVLSHGSAFARSAAATALFICASAATYLVNDVLDAGADRLHPVKANRPIASGRLSPSVALVAAAILLIVTFIGAAALSVSLVVVLIAYLAITFSYSLALKRVAVIELGAVSAGFVLRAAAGAAAVHIGLSQWFLIVTSAGALFIVAGKRSAEHAQLGEERAADRQSLGAYPERFLRSVRLLASSVAITGYCLWVFDRASESLPVFHGRHLTFFEFSIVPFVLAVLVVELAIETGRGGEPEELALRDRPLQLLGLCWIALIALGIYG